MEILRDILIAIISGLFGYLINAYNVKKKRQYELEDKPKDPMPNYTNFMKTLTKFVDDSFPKK